MDEFFPSLWPFVDPFGPEITRGIQSAIRGWKHGITDDEVSCSHGFIF